MLMRVPLLLTTNIYTYLFYICYGLRCMRPLLGYTWRVVCQCSVFDHPCIYALLPVMFLYVVRFLFYSCLVYVRNYVATRGVTPVVPLWISIYRMFMFTIDIGIVFMYTGKQLRIINILTGTFQTKFSLLQCNHAKGSSHEQRYACNSPHRLHSWRLNTQ